MRYIVTIGGRTIEVDLTGPRPRVDGREIDADLRAVPGTAVRHLIVDGAAHTLIARPGSRKGVWRLRLNGQAFEAQALDERTRAIRQMAGAADVETDKEIVAPMPGLVVRVNVEAGQSVKAGQGIVVVEAMKMENELRAPGDGTIARVEVAAGQTVEKGAVLIVLE